MKLSLLYQQTSKSARTRSTKASANAPQSSKVKRKGPKSTKSQEKRQKTTPPSPPPQVSPIRVESSPEVRTQQAQSTPQPQEAPQPEETSADVHEQIADAVSSIIASVVSSIQTSTAPPQGKALSMKSLSMDLSLQLIIIPVNLFS